MTGGTPISSRENGHLLRQAAAGAIGFEVEDGFNLLEPFVNHRSQVPRVEIPVPLVKPSRVQLAGSTSRRLIAQGGAF